MSGPAALGFGPADLVVGDQYALAKALDVPQTRISQIVSGQRSITADTGLRLARALGLSDGFWANLQARCDLDMARAHLGDELDHIRGWRVSRG